VLGDEAGAAEVPVVEEPAPAAPDAAAQGSDAPSEVRKIDGPEAAPLQLSSVMGGRTRAKLALPVVLALVVLVVIVVLLLA
jgi:hypothetical protein